MTEGYMALCVSILKGVPPEKAFALLAGKPGRKEGCGRKPRKQWGRTEKDLMRIMRRKGETWGNIGRKFGISGEHARALAMHHAGKAGRDEIH